MRELSLFSGAGGGILGSKILGWKTLGYVEWEGYCQKIIKQRIKDGIFDEAPIFGDIRTFVSEGYARRYRGMVDVVSGGFPCQPFSVAGKRKASDDERNMWPATLDVIKAVEPPIVFFENVPGLLSATVDDESGRSIHYFGTILRDLAESGYDLKWTVLGADDVGAPHHRKRLWILGVHADTKHNGHLTLPKFRGDEAASDSRRKEESNRTGESKGVDKSRNAQGIPGSINRGERGGSRNVADTTSKGRERHQRQGGKRGGGRSAGSGEILSNTRSSRQSGSWWAFDPSDPAEERDRQEHRVEHDSRWGVESHVGRVVNGLADKTNRLKAIGNGQVPLTMAAAYAILSNEFNN